MEQKSGYMALGAGILAIGITIGQFVTPDIEARNNGVFDKIICREIEVIDKNGKTAIWLMTDEHGGRVSVLGKDDGIASMSTDQHGGVVGVFNNQGKTRAFMGVDAFGNGGVATLDKNGYLQ